MESCQFPYAYTVISGLLDIVDNSKQQKILSCVTLVANKQSIHAD